MTAVHSRETRDQCPVGHDKEQQSDQADDNYGGAELARRYPRSSIAFWYSA